MPKISALPVSGALDVADLVPVVDQSTATTKQATIAQFQAAIGGGGGGVGTPPPYLVCVPSDAPTSLRTAIAAAGVPWTQLTGTNDSAAVSAAILAASTTSAAGGAGSASGVRWGRVLIAGGNVDVDQPILMRDGVWVQGMGWLTHFLADGCTETTGAGPGSGMFKLATESVQATALTDLHIDGNLVAGGGCHGLYYYSASGVYDDQPIALLEPYHYASRLLLTGHNGVAGRANVRLEGANLRGCDFSHVVARDAETYNVHVDNAASVYSAIVAGGGKSGNYLVGGAENAFADCRGFSAGGTATTTGDGWTVSTARNTFSSCSSKDAARDGWRINASASLGACVADNAGRLAAGDGFRFAGSNISASGLVACGSGTATQLYGYRFVSGSGLSIVGTSFSNVTGGHVGTASADSFVRLRGQSTYSVEAPDPTGVRVVVHGAVAGTARPTGYGSIMWIGSVAPSNAVNSTDTWLDNG